MRTTFKRKGEESMRPIPRYDIFKLSKDGSVMWVGASENLRGIVMYAMKQPIEPDQLRGDLLADKKIEKEFAIGDSRAITGIGRSLTWKKSRSA